MKLKKSMLNTKKLVVGLALCSGAGHALATDYYFDAAATRINFSEPGHAQNPTVLRVAIGTHISDHWALEAMAGVGSGSSSAYYQSVYASYKVNSISGLYLKTQTQAGESSEVYAKLGYATIQTTTTASSGGWTSSLSHTSSGLSYAVGATYHVNKKNHLFVDFTSYDNNAGIKLSGPSIGMSFDF
jgi:hypothetical protein